MIFLIEVDIAIVCFLVLFCIHIYMNFLNLKNVKNPIIIFLFSIIIFLFGSYFFYFFTEIKFIKLYLNNLCFYLMFVMVYLHIFVGILKSVSIRILNELLLKDSKKLSLKDLKNEYSHQDLFNARIDSLVKNNWIKLDKGYYDLGFGKKSSDELLKDKKSFIKTKIERKTRQFKK